MKQKTIIPQSKMRLLLIEPNPSDATSFYRSRGVLPFLEKRYPTQFTLQYPKRWDKIDWTDAVQADVAFVQRPAHRHNVHTIALLKECGVGVVVDYDDDIINIKDHNPVYEHYQNNIEHAVACIRMADALIVSTQALKDVYAPYNDNIHVIPNAHNDYLFPVSQKADFKYNHVAYYRGGSTHQRDVFINADSIVKMIKENPAWKFYFIGDRFHFLEAKTEGCKNHFVMGYQPTLEFLKMVNGMNPCAHFTFLEQTVFNMSKSNCGWLEATYAGAASFAPVGFPEFINKGIIQYANVDASFYSHVQTAGKYLMRDAHNQSWEYIKKNLLLSEVNRLRYDLLNAL